ncbi:MAG: HD domain-containing protein [Clostridiales bacterium]|nr:HD domain-containing protein [Clostridiales bacterium]
MSGISDSGTKKILSKEKSGRKMELPIEQCKPGMFIAETIYNNMGAIIILDNTLLDNPAITRLKGLDIRSIKVYERQEECGGESPEERFDLFYSSNISLLKDAFQDVFSGKPLNMEKVDQLSEAIVKMEDSADECLKSLWRGKGDEYLFMHSMNVAMLAMLIAGWMKIEGEELKDIVKAGLLHDIGKSRLDHVEGIMTDSPLVKPKNEEIKKHVKLGWEIVTDAIGKGGRVPAAILMHHENIDGSGYPNRLKADEISVHAKILAVANTFDQLTTAHFKLKSVSPFEAFGIIEEESSSKLDSIVAARFLENAPSYFLHEKFFLSNGDIGEVIFINPRKTGRPVLKVGDSYLDLSREEDIRIQGML